MKLFVPSCGQKLTLKKDWTFTLFFEYRNFKFVQSIKPEAMKNEWDYDKDEAIMATLPKGTVLTVARVYVRNGDAGEYNSLTFNALQPGKKKGHRFWVKLEDANNIDCEPLEVVTA